MHRLPNTPHPDNSHRISHLSGLSLQPQLDNNKNNSVQDQDKLFTTTINFTNDSSRFHTRPHFDSNINIFQPVIKQVERFMLSKYF